MIFDGEMEETLKREKQRREEAREKLQEERRS